MKAMSLARLATMALMAAIALPLTAQVRTDVPAPVPGAKPVKTERIKEDADYEGVRVRFVGLLGKARVTMQIDVGFGDVVTPGAETIRYPALLDFPAPELSGYPRETVVAELAALGDDRLELLEVGRVYDF